MNAIARRALSPPLVLEHREQHVVLPFIVDAEIFAGVALLAEADLEEEALARDVGRQARGFDAVEAEAMEGEVEGGGERVGHIAAPRMALADPVAEAAGLGDAAADT